MFTHLRLNNFKSWEKADIRFGQITGLFGTNSSGKSSLNQFLLLLKQTKESSDPNIALNLNGPYVQLGTMPDAIFEHKEELPIDYEIGIRLPKPIAIKDPGGSSNNPPIVESKDLKISSEIRLKNSTPTGYELVYGFGEMDEAISFSLKHKKTEPTKFELKVQGETDFRFIRTPGRAWNLPGPVKSYRFPDQSRTYYQNSGFLSDLEFAFETCLDGLYYLGPMRKNPQRDYSRASSRPTGVGKSGEYTIDAILAAQESGQKRNLIKRGRLKEFSEMVAFWLKKMGLIHGFRLEEIKHGSNIWQIKIQMQKGRSEVEVLLPDVGFGVSQILPVITLLYYVPEGSTVILEQPEIHLHPLAQAELADLIVNVSMHRNVQIILESHSEHLLLRLQRLIAEEEIDAEEVKLYFCDNPKGYSRAEYLELDELGNIENWPPLFMGDAFTETTKAELARIKRRKSAAS